MNEMKFNVQATEIKDFFIACMPFKCTGRLNFDFKKNKTMTFGEIAMRSDVYVIPIV